MNGIDPVEVFFKWFRGNPQLFVIFKIGLCVYTGELGLAGRGHRGEENPRYVCGDFWREKNDNPSFDGKARPKTKPALFADWEPLVWKVILGLRNTSTKQYILSFLKNQHNSPSSLSLPLNTDRFFFPFILSYLANLLTIVVFLFVVLFLSTTGTGPSKRLNAEQQRLVASPVEELDTILALLAAAAPVDVMPGGVSRRFYYCFLNHQRSI